MQISLAIILALASFGLAAPVADNVQSGAADIEPRAGDFWGSVVGTFSDDNCQYDQKDLSQKVLGRLTPECQHLPGQSMKIWWLEKGCQLVMWKNRTCDGQPDAFSNLNQCYKIKDYSSFKTYCE